jgi:hypothetical protein
MAALSITDMSPKQRTLVGVLGFIAFFLILTAIQMGPVPAIVFTVALGGGLVLWLATTHETQVDPLQRRANHVLVAMLRRCSLMPAFQWMIGK